MLQNILLGACVNCILLHLTPISNTNIWVWEHKKVTLSRFKNTVLSAKTQTMSAVDSFEKTNHQIQQKYVFQHKTLLE